MGCSTQEVINELLENQKSKSAIFKLMDFEYETIVPLKLNYKFIVYWLLFRIIRDPKFNQNHARNVKMLIREFNNFQLLSSDYLVRRIMCSFCLRREGRHIP